MHVIKFVLIGFIAASAQAFVIMDGLPPVSSVRHVSSLFYRDSDVNDGAYLVNKRIPDFKQRMRNLVKQQQRKSWRPNNMKTAVTLEEYANVIKEGREKKCIVIVNFHATWCKVIIVFFCPMFRAAYHIMLNHLNRCCNLP